MIVIKNLMKKYKNNLVLNIPYFNFKSGNSYIIIGSNGSGKSTLIKCLLGINKIDSGFIDLRTNNIGYIPEKYYFPDFCTINKFLQCILDLYDLQKNNILIDYYCNKFSLDKNKSISKLSKGMMQKVLIIQSLIHDAHLYIFDEPLNGLDSKSQKVFFDIVDELKEKDKTVIITTHYPEFYVNKYDYTLRIEKKKLVYENN